jgi:hypothetical protein
MRDIPFFQWEGCVATLALSEIPYRRKAYVLVRLAPAEKLRAFMKECVAFCRMAGAQRIYASAEHPLETGVPAYALVRYVCPRAALQPVNLELTPLNAENQHLFLELQRQLFQSVDGAATYTLQDCERIKKAASGFLWMEGGTPIGIGELRNGEIGTVGVTRPGTGGTLVRALAGKLSSEVVSVQTASTNERAIRLYEKLGFRLDEVLSDWYLIE